MKIKLAISLDKNVLDKIDKKADSENRTRSNTIETILWDYLYKQIDNKGIQPRNE
jgi:metal-responsive CopG/Arc/MetJ family transcriptional regulator